MSSNNNNNSEKDVSLVQQNNNNIASSSTSTPNTSTNDDEEIITQLTLAGLKVLMVRKRDQIIYKLPDNMQVSAIGEQQRQQLMKEIQSLHAATMAAAANAQQQQQQQLQQKSSDIKPIAPKNEILNPLDTPPKPTAAETDAMNETARKLREELEQQQNDNKSTRKYNKTGKYSKKRQQQLQQQLYQQLQQQYPQQQQLTQQQLLALQQSLQQQTTITTSYESRSSPSTPITANATAASTPICAIPNSSFSFSPIAQQQKQQQDGNANSSTIPPTLPPVPLQQKTLPPADSILSKRLPEEELQHREVKRRCVESLLADHKSVTFPDYEKPFTSVKDAMERLLPYHIYQYPKGDLDANKIPLERQDHTMIEIFKCQSDLFEKHGKISKKIEKTGGKSSLKVLVERQVLTEQRQKLTEEQNRLQAEQTAQHQEMVRIQNEKARLAKEGKHYSLPQQQQIQPQPQQLLPQQQLQHILQQILPQQALDQLLQQQQQQNSAANYANGVAQASALLQNPQFVNQYSQLSPDLQAKLLRNREQLVALLEKQQNSSTNNNNSQQQ
ncbi:hypothetical protein [Parasitella parasitica]|uniref:GLTSCR protein conserved domain-containing protein n=1 Tax=Parasitella parasitica TaxID=35722 RepID=A0A0B7NL28_9FUNG|nr:hypothetical protein [Parasitella parasitica]